jgi:hypothetical protein
VLPPPVRLHQTRADLRYVGLRRASDARPPMQPDLCLLRQPVHAMQQLRVTQRGDEQLDWRL